MNLFYFIIKAWVWCSHGHNYMYIRHLLWLSLSSDLVPAQKANFVFSTDDLSVQAKIPLKSKLCITIFPQSWKLSVFYLVLQLYAFPQSLARADFSLVHQVNNVVIQKHWGSFSRIYHDKKSEYVTLFGRSRLKENSAVANHFKIIIIFKYWQCIQFFQIPAVWNHSWNRC